MVTYGSALTLLFLSEVGCIFQSRESLHLSASVCPFVHLKLYVRLCVCVCSANVAHCDHSVASIMLSLSMGCF